ncbi:MAG: hypothetical protein KJ000_16595 [Pirellulaceae bacterium]|nr:hypothetical protein [Pirellulaceae bacterium]
MNYPCLVSLRHGLAAAALLSSRALLAVALFTAAQPAAGKPPSLAPVKEAGGAVVFEAGHSDPAAINNYTASWRKGSDLTPSTRPVTKDGEPYVEFSFRGSQGMACSTIYFDPTPPPDAGRIYRGLRLIIDCDRDDYPHMGISVHFQDKSALTVDKALERGRQEYLIETGFRREKHPPRWDQIPYVMLTLEGSRHPLDLVYRLKRISVPQVADNARPNDEEDEHLRGGADRAADRFCEPLLSPRPKEIAWEQGVFPASRDWPLVLETTATERTRRTAALFAERYHGFTAHRLLVQTFDALPPASGIVLRLAGGEVEPSLLPQGYTLSVEPERVVITGADEPGLYYGTVTFFQLLKHALKKVTDTAPVPCVTVRDWPDTPNRLVRLEHPHTFRNCPVQENRGIDYLIDWTERFVADQKINTFYIDLAANVRYQRRPEFNGSEKIYTLADLRRFGDFCRDHFIDLCPAWQVGGHANWWLILGYHPELREKGWESQGDVTHPDHDAIVHDCMLDVIEALRPKYVSPKSDEWWGRRQDGETIDELLRGKTRAQAFLEWHVRLNEWLKARGITMMIFEDMLSPYHNGKKFDVYKIIDAFPKDIILTQWAGGNLDKEIRYFTERGFRVWPNATGMFTLSPDARSRVMGFGKGIYSFGNERKGLLDEYSSLASMSVLLRTADYAWNFAREEDLDAGRMVAIQHAAALRPNPRAAARVEPIALGPALTHSFDAFLKTAKPDAYADHARPVDLPAGPREIGFLPMRLGGGADGRDCIVLGKDAAPAALPVRGRFASLVFLHSAFIDNPEDKGAQGASVRAWMYGWPCGNYEVHYADGSQAILPVRLTNNIKRFDTASANRATLDNRYAWSLDGADGQPIHLFQWEWVNPKPDQEIVGVTAAHDHVLDVTLLVFAVSGRPLAGE